MSTDLVAQIARAGEQIIVAPAPGIADELNRQLNQVLGWPFQAASGTAFDREGLGCVDGFNQHRPARKTDDG